MLSDCRRAVRTIDIERYIFCCDTIGNQFIEVFLRKAREGVRVRIIADMVGSFDFYRSGIVQKLEAAGVEVRFFNPISAWRIDGFTANFFRDHRKIMIVDDAVGYIGGVGIDAKTALWRDTEARLEGVVAGEMSHMFSRMWANAGRKKMFFKFKRPTIVARTTNILPNAPRRGQRHVYHAYLDAIRSSARYVYLATPYFIPDIKFLRAVRLAAKRGVDVRLIVPSFSDHAFIDNSTRSYFTLLLTSGVKVYLYKDSMMHAKTAVIDDVWATVGSFNLDNLSFRYNYEANVISTDRQFIEGIRTQFTTDLTYCRRVEYEEWIHRPLMSKIKEFVTWPFHAIF